MASVIMKFIRHRPTQRATIKQGVFIKSGKTIRRT